MQLVLGGAFCCGRVKSIVQQVHPAVRPQVNLTNFLVTRYTSALTLQVGFSRRPAGCHMLTHVNRPCCAAKAEPV
jgi:hypothetical protein